MKKVLFATTALVAAGIAGAASAQGIELSGDARMGLLYVDIEGLDSDTVGTSRARVKFSGSGTSDSGLTFGFNFRTSDLSRGDHASPDDQGFDLGDGAVSSRGDVFVSGSFGAITYGDTDAASAKRVKHVDAISLTGLGDTHEITRNIQPASRIRYDYDFDSFGFSVSTQGDLEQFAVGASYSGDFGGTAIDFGIGYDSNDDLDVEIISASAGATFGSITGRVAYASLDGDLDDIAVSLKYSQDMIAVAAFYHTLTDGSDSIDTYGVGASYDLGGGLSVKGGVAMLSGDFIPDITTADLGLAMEF